MFPRKREAQAGCARDGKEETLSPRLPFGVRPSTFTPLSCGVRTGSAEYENPSVDRRPQRAELARHRVAVLSERASRSAKFLIVRPGPCARAKASSRSARRRPTSCGSGPVSIASISSTRIASSIIFGSNPMPLVLRGFARVLRRFTTGKSLGPARTAQLRKAPVWPGDEVSGQVPYPVSVRLGQPLEDVQALRRPKCRTLYSSELR